MIAVRLPETIETRLQSLAQRTGRTVSYYVRAALDAYLADLESHHATDTVSTGPRICVYYRIPAPHSWSAVVEVYGDPDMGWSEWRIIDGGRVLRDSGSDPHLYGQTSVALREGLLAATDLFDSGGMS